MKIAIVVNLTKEKAIACAHKIIEILREAGAQPVMPPECEMDFSNSGAAFAPSVEQLFETADAAVTVGGDGFVGEDGATHHGILDLAQTLAVPYFKAISHP